MPLNEAVAAVTRSEVPIMATLVKPLRNGQITIPIAMRRELGIDEQTMLQLSVTEDREIRIKPMRLEDRPKGSPWARELYEYFAPVREEVAASGMTEQEIDDLIDAALLDYREGRD